MDAWPSDNRQLIPETTKNKRKNKKGKEKQHAESSSAGYPVFELGSLTAATLIEKDGRLGWTTVGTNATGSRIVPKGPAQKIFPATRSLPAPLPHTTPLQRAEQASHFLRKYHPDLDVPFELIRDELDTDEKFSRAIDVFDPSAGNALEAVTLSDRPRKQTIYLAFPTGELGNDLNISPFIHRRDHSVFKPVASPVQSFETPIQQIISSQSNQTMKNRLLAVRTSASTTVLELKQSGGGMASQLKPAVDAPAIATFRPTDTGGRTAADLSFSPYLPSTLLLVNLRGDIYKCTMGPAGKSSSIVYRSLDASPEDQFWRVRWGVNYTIGLLASHSVVRKLDLRTSAGSSKIFSVKRSGETITSIESQKVDQEHLMCFSTTSELIWVDDRNTKRPILGYKHGREHERTLQVETVVVTSSHLTFLTSRKTGFVSVYDVSRVDGLLHSHYPPICLPSLATQSARCSGQVIFRHHADREHDMSLLQLLDDGSLQQLRLKFVPDLASDVDAPMHLIHPDFEWSADIEQLEKFSKSLCQDTGPLGEREYSEIDLQPVYERLFMKEPHDVEDNGEALYETLERMPAFWQHSDLLVDHLLTSFDIAFRSGNEPNEQSRSDFLSQSALSSVRGSHALVQKRIPFDQLGRHIPFERNISSTLRHFIPGLAELRGFNPDYLRKYDLSDDADRPGPSLRRETYAREQLEVDMALSTDIFSAHAFVSKAPDAAPALESTVEEALETMSRATEALSLDGAEPPPVHFGYLRPVQKDHYKAGQAQTNIEPTSQELSLPIGVRLLLAEWEIGSDPDAYVYKDPYDTSISEDDIAMTKKAGSTADAKSQSRYQQSQSQATAPMRPPMVVAASSLTTLSTHATPVVGQRRPPFIMPSQSQLAPITRRDDLRTGSQPTREGTWLEESSQDFMASTQVLPGPFGGRQQMNKKPLKKRIGGF